MEKIKLKDISFLFKDGIEVLDFIKQCWLIPPEVVEDLPESMVQHYAKQIADSIHTLGDAHMIQFQPEEVTEFMRRGLSFVLTEPKMQEVLGFAKFYPWQSSNENIVAFEIGSLFVKPAIQGHHIGQLLVEQLSRFIMIGNSHVPIVSVVTFDNDPSIKLYRRMGWSEVESTDHNNYVINGVNILEGWGHPSSIFYHPDTIRI